MTLLLRTDVLKKLYQKLEGISPKLLHSYLYTVYMGTSLLSLRKKNTFMRASKVSASSRIGDKAEDFSLMATTEKNPCRLWRWTPWACTSVSLLQGSWQQPGRLTGAPRQCLLPGLKSSLKGSELCWAAQCVRRMIFQHWKSNPCICLYFWLFASSLNHSRSCGSEAEISHNVLPWWVRSQLHCQPYPSNRAGMKKRWLN